MFIIYSSISIYRILVNVFRIGSRKRHARLSSQSLKIKGRAARQRFLIDLRLFMRRTTSAVNERRTGTIPSLSSAFHSENNVQHGNTLLYMSFSGVKGRARGCHSVATGTLTTHMNKSPTCLIILPLRIRLITLSNPYKYGSIY